MHGQVGFEVLLTPRNQNGGAPLSTSEDIAIVSNLISRFGSGVSLVSRSNNNGFAPDAMWRVLMHNGVLEVDRAAMGGDGRIFEFGSVPSDGSPKM